MGFWIAELWEKDARHEREPEVKIQFSFFIK